MATAENNNQKSNKRILADKSRKMELNNDLRQPLSDEESFPRSFVVDVNKQTVIAKYTFKLSKDDKHTYPMETTFDFSGCSHQELLELAATTIRIAAQARLRKMGNKALQRNIMRSMNVKADFIDASRQQADESVRAVRSLSRTLNIDESAARAIIERERSKNATPAA